MLSRGSECGDGHGERRIKGERQIGPSENPEAYTEKEQEKG